MKGQSAAFGQGCFWIQLPIPRQRVPRSGLLGLGAAESSCFVHEWLRVISYKTRVFARCFQCRFKFDPDCDSLTDLFYCMCIYVYGMLCVSHNLRLFQCSAPPDLTLSFWLFFFLFALSLVKFRIVSLMRLDVCRVFETSFDQSYPQRSNSLRV